MQALGRSRNQIAEKKKIKLEKNWFVATADTLNAMHQYSEVTKHRAGFAVKVVLAGALHYIVFLLLLGLGKFER